MAVSSAPKRATGAWRTPVKQQAQQVSTLCTFCQAVHPGTPSSQQELTLTAVPPGVWTTVAQGVPTAWPPPSAATWVAPGTSTLVAAPPPSLSSLAALAPAGASTWTAAPGAFTPTVVASARPSNLRGERVPCSCKCEVILSMPQFQACGSVSRARLRLRAALGPARQAARRPPSAPQRVPGCLWLGGRPKALPEASLGGTRPLCSAFKIAECVDEVVLLENGASRDENVGLIPDSGHLNTR